MSSKQRPSVLSSHELPLDIRELIPHLEKIFKYKYPVDCRDTNEIYYHEGQRKVLEWLRHKFIQKE